jgi:hypothetical protein
VDLLEPQAADDTRLTERLARLVNDVYAVAEAGLWRDGADRTTAAEIAGLVRGGRSRSPRATARSPAPSGCATSRTT